MVLDFFLNYVPLLVVNVWSVKNEMIFNFFRLNTDERITLYIVRKSYVFLVDCCNHVTINYTDFTTRS